MKRSVRISAYLLASLFALGLLGAIGVGAAYLVLAPTLPSVERLHQIDFQEPLRVYTAGGELIADYGVKQRIPISYDQAPQALVQAFIAAEDKRFYEHPGVDYQGILRAIWYLVRTGEKGPGGSTITMQVARNFFLTPEQTYIRKVKEIFLALKIEQEFTKHEILELYMNKIYLGQGAYGVGAAARVYYGKPLEELTLAQLAMIAGLPKAPSAWNPIADPERALARRGYVLGRMREQGFISAAEYRQAMEAPITAEHQEDKLTVEALYIAEMVRREMVERFGEEAAYQEGYSVYTTIDADRQRAAVDALRDDLHLYDERHGYRGPVKHVELDPDAGPADRKRLLSTVPTYGELRSALVLAVGDESATVFGAGRGEPWQLPFEAMAWAKPFVSRLAVGEAPNEPADVVSPGDIIYLRQTDDDAWRLAQLPEVSGALVSLDPYDGHIIALVGGYDYHLSKFNRVIQAKRQPGSAFKPFIYSAALANGLTAATMINDAPIVLHNDTTDKFWRPENYGHRFFGPTRLREALVHSRNLVSIRVLRRVGIERTIEHLTRFGFDADQLPHGLSLALGTAAVTPLTLARGYAVFANDGFLVDPYFIDRIVNDQGEVIYQSTPVVACGESCRDGAPEQAPAETGGDAAAVPVGLHGDDTDPAPRVLPATNAYLMTTMMRDVVRNGTGQRAMSLGRSDLAGKTGTTDEQHDAWFAGFNHALVTTVWVGFDQYAPLGFGETGAGAALPMWIDYMDDALEGVPEKPLEQPPGLVTVRIDKETGLVTSASNPDAMFEIFREGNVPARESPLRAGAGSDGEPGIGGTLF